MAEKKSTKKKPTKRKQGNNNRKFKKEKPEIIKLLKNGASYNMIKNYFGMTGAEWTKFYNDNEIDVKQARAIRQLALINKTNDLAVNHNNFNALRMLLINETELQDKVEQKVETVQAVNIVNNDDELETIETLSNCDSE